MSDETDAVRVEARGFPEAESAPAARRRRFSRTSIWLAAGGVACAVIVSAALAVSAGPPARDELAPFQRLDEGRWRYTLHVPSGSEALFDLDRDRECRKNVVHDHPDVADRLQLRLLERCGVDSLDELRAPYHDTIEVLEGLGYL